MRRDDITALKDCELVWANTQCRMQNAQCTMHNANELVLKNPFWHDFPEQDIHMEWTMPPVGMSAKLMCDDTEVEWEQDKDGKILFFTNLPMRSEKRFTWICEGDVGTNGTENSLITNNCELITHLFKQEGDIAIIDTGKVAYRMSWNAISADRKSVV